MRSNFLVKSLLLIYLAHYYLIECIITLSEVFLQLLRHLLRLGFWLIWFVSCSLLEAKLTYYSMCWTAAVFLDKCVCYGCFATCIQKQRVFDGWILPEETRHCLMASRAICEHVTSFGLTLAGATIIMTSRWLTCSLHSIKHWWNWSLHSALTGLFDLQVALLESRSIDCSWWIDVGVWNALLYFGGLVFWII